MESITIALVVAVTSFATSFAMLGTVAIPLIFVLTAARLVKTRALAVLVYVGVATFGAVRIGASAYHGLM